MNFLVAISLAYLAYNGIEVLIKVVYKKYIVYTKRINNIRDHNSIGYKPQSSKKAENEVKLKSFEQLEQDLILAEINLKPKEFTVLSIGLGAFAFLVIFLVKHNPIFAIGGLLAGYFTPKLVLKKKKDANLLLFSEQLGDAIMVISNSLRAGFTFEQSLKSIAKDLPNPAGREFKKIIQEVELGEKIETVMYDVSQSMNSDDMELMTTAVVIQREVGGNLADVLDNIGQTIRDRSILKKNIKTLTAQGEMSGKVIGFLPIILLFAISMMNPEYMAPMFNTTYGYVMLSISAFLEIIGYLSIKKLINIEI